MAAHSPVGLDLETAASPKTLDGSYVEGWRDITRQMDKGASWSGRENNCAYLNLGERRFVNISAAAGLDHVQDGRAVAQLDWDGDGDLDFWLKSRNGQQLRLLENTRDTGTDFVSLRLRGMHCNRDAFGARVEVKTTDHTYVQELRCGEGYLAQSSSELVFGLNGAQSVEAVTVHWPGGAAETFANVRMATTNLLVEGAGEAQELARPAAALVEAAETSEAREMPQLSSSARVVLRSPLPLPTVMLQEFCSDGPPQARLLNLWATWCAPCVGELREFASHSEELAYVGLEIVPLCLDGEENPEAATALFDEQIAPLMKDGAKWASRNLSESERSVFDVLFQHLIAKPGSLPVPASLLVDKHGMVEVMYLGPVDVNTLIEDAATFGMEPEKIGVRCNFPGRWFYGMPRDLDGLGRTFRERKLSAYASYYSALAEMIRRRQ